MLIPVEWKEAMKVEMDALEKKKKHMRLSRIVSRKAASGI